MIEAEVRQDIWDRSGGRVDLAALTGRTEDRCAGQAELWRMQPRALGATGCACAAARDVDMRRCEARNAPGGRERAVGTAAARDATRHAFGRGEPRVLFFRRELRGVCVAESARRGLTAASALFSLCDVVCGVCVASV
jgi:hypothetical protein